MVNTHSNPNVTAEVQAICGDLLAPAILASTLAVPGSGMTLPAFSTYGYVRNGTPTRLCYVNQPAAPVTLAGGSGTYWLALLHDTHSAVAGWTRAPGTHYCWQFAATQPANPPGGLVMASVTVASGTISAIDATINFPGTKVAYGGGAGLLAFDKDFYYDPAINRVSASQFLANDLAGDNVWGLYSATNAAGGTNRFALITAGDAPSRLGGALTVVGNVSFNGTLNVSSNVGVGGSLSVTSNVGVGGSVSSPSWAGFTGGISAGAQAPPASPRKLDVLGDAYVSGHTGLGVAPAPGQYHLNCGSANFLSVSTPSLTATTLGATNVTATTLTASGTLHANRLESTTWVTAADANIAARVLCFRLGLSGGDPGGTYALYSAGGSHFFNGPVGVQLAPSTGGYALAAASIYSADSLYAVNGVNAGSLFVRGGSQFAGLIGVSYGADPGYWLRIPSIWVDTLRMANGSVDSNFTVGGTVTAGHVTATGNMSCGLMVVSASFGSGYHLSAASIHSAGAMLVAGALTTSGAASVGTDLFVGSRIGIGVSPSVGNHLTLFGPGAVKPGGGPFADSSSRTMKRHIARIENALTLLLEQQGCRYEWEEPTRAALLPGVRYGLVAEEVTLPQWRQEAPDGTVSIAANGFEALAIEAFRAIVTRLEALEELA